MRYIKKCFTWRGIILFTAILFCLSLFVTGLVKAEDNVAPQISDNLSSDLDLVLVLVNDYKLITYDYNNRTDYYTPKSLAKFNENLELLSTQYLSSNKICSEYVFLNPSINDVRTSDYFNNISINWDIVRGDVKSYWYEKEYIQGVYSDNSTLINYHKFNLSDLVLLPNEVIKVRLCGDVEYEVCGYDNIGLPEYCLLIDNVLNLNDGYDYSKYDVWNRTLGLQGEWLFNEEDARDTSGNGYNGSLENGVLCNVNGKYGKGCLFDGINDYIVVNEHEFIDNMEEYTISVWVKLYDFTNLFPRIIAKNRYLNSSSPSGWQLYFINYSVPEFQRYISAERTFSNTLSIVRASNNSATLNQWQHITMTYNTNTDNMNLYINGILDNADVENGGGTMGEDGNRPILFGNRGYLVRTLNGSLDDIYIYNRILNITEINELMDYNSSYLPPPPSYYYSNIDILFMNTSGDYKQSFSPIEDFTIWGNYTDNNTNLPINDTNTSCNFTIHNMSLHNTLSYNEFSICNTGCDYNTINEDTYFYDINNVTSNSIFISLCHLKNINYELYVNISCDTESELLTIGESEFTICDTGYTLINKVTTKCINKTNLSISIYNNAPSDQLGHNVSYIDIHRKYLTHTDTGYYNITQKMYYLNHTFHGHTPSIKFIDFQCWNTAQPTYNNNVTENITIGNLPPKIFFEQLLNNGEYTNLVNNITIEYYSDFWLWYIIFTDQNLDTHNITFYNTSRISLWSHQDTDLDNYHNLSYDIFKNHYADNPYNLSVWVNDTSGVYVYDYMYFYVNDTINPICTGLDNDTIYDNESYTFNFLCYDEIILYYNVSCNNTFNNHTEFLSGNTTSVNFTNIFNSTNVSYYCNVTICDGYLSPLHCIDYTQYIITSPYPVIPPENVTGTAVTIFLSNDTTNILLLMFLFIVLVGCLIWNKFYSDYASLILSFFVSIIIALIGLEVHILIGTFFILVSLYLILKLYIIFINEHE